MTTTTEPTIQILPLDSIDADPTQPRKRFERQALAELATSIASVGLLEPIIVRPVAGRFVIVAGERRWRASREAGLATIPAIVKDLDAGAAFELSMIENVVRADMNPIEEANGYAKLLDAGLDVATIAARIGKSAASITARLALLRLAAPVADLVAAGQVDGFVAGHLARLTAEGQYRVVAQLNRAPMGPLDAARLCTAIAEQEATISAFGDDWMTVPATIAPLAIMPTVDHRREQLTAALERAAAALVEADRLVADDVEGDLAELVAIEVRVRLLVKAQARRRAVALAKAV